MNEPRGPALVVFRVRVRKRSDGYGLLQPLPLGVGVSPLAFDHGEAAPASGTTKRQPQKASQPFDDYCPTVAILDAVEVTSFASDPSVIGSLPVGSLRPASLAIAAQSRLGSLTVFVLNRLH